MEFKKWLVRVMIVLGLEKSDIDKSLRDDLKSIWEWARDDNCNIVAEIKKLKSLNWNSKPYNGVLGEMIDKLIKQYKVALR